MYQFPLEGGRRFSWTTRLFTESLKLFSIPTSKEPKSKDSMASSSKRQNQAWQLIFNWTPQHMDAYLTIPELAMEWNVEPG
jgi:hypothetical protein